MAKTAIRSVELEPIDRLEEKVKLLVSMVERMKLESARVVEDNQRLLREPTPMSRRMRPALTNLSRWVCRLVEQGSLDEASHLAAWTLGAEPADDGRAAGRLLAERMPHATALPWLQSGQTQPVEGAWLVCMPLDSARVRDPLGPPGAAVYARLPVG